MLASLVMNPVLKLLKTLVLFWNGSILYENGLLSCIICTKNYLCCKVFEKFVFFWTVSFCTNCSFSCIIREKIYILFFSKNMNPISKLLKTLGFLIGVILYKLLVLLHHSSKKLTFFKTWIPFQNCAILYKCFIFLHNWYEKFYNLKIWIPLQNLWTRSFFELLNFVKMARSHASFVKKNIFIFEKM